MGQAEIISDPDLKLKISDKTFDNSFVSQKIINLDVQSKPKYMSQVNLDALIPREDLEIKEAKYSNINQINNVRLTYKQLIAK